MAKSKRKNNNTRWLILVVSIIGLAGYSVFTYWRQMQETAEAKFAMYPAFGIELPLGFPIHGIDVSSYQHSVYWPLVKKMECDGINIGFTFIKATEGLNSADIQFKRNWQQAKQAGIVRGAYHFFLATKSGKLQAQNFIKNVKLEPGDLPPVLDVENLYGTDIATLQKGVNEWLQMVEAAYKIKPIIYSYTDFYQKNLGNRFNAYPLWVAHYFNEGNPRINRDWTFWQHSDAGKVNGITSKVDFNVFKGDSLAFVELLLK